MVAGSSPALGVVSVWRNWIARETSNLKVAGSSPVTDFQNPLLVTLLEKGKDVHSNSIIQNFYYLIVAS